MANSRHLRARLMDGGVQQEPDGIDHAAAAHNLSLMVHLDQMRYLDLVHGGTDRIDPEVIGQLGVTHRDVTQQPLGESAPAKDATSGGEALQQVSPLRLLAVEARWNPRCEALYADRHDGSPGVRLAAG